MIFVSGLFCNRRDDGGEKEASHPTSGDEVEASRAEKPNDGVRRPGSVTRREFAFPRGWKVEEQRQRLRGSYWVGWTEGLEGGRLDRVNVLTYTLARIRRKGEQERSRMFVQLQRASRLSRRRTWLPPLSLSLSLSLPFSSSVWSLPSHPLSVGGLSHSVFVSRSSPFRPCEIQCQWRNQWGTIDPTLHCYSLTLTPPSYSRPALPLANSIASSLQLSGRCYPLLLLSRLRST